MKDRKNKNFINSLKNAFNGLIYAFKSSRNFKIELVFASLVLIFAYIFKISIVELLICLLCITTVLSLEIINSSIEEALDLITKDYNIHVKNGKDLAASAVLLASIMSAIIGLIIFLPKILNIIGV